MADLASVPVLLVQPFGESYPDVVEKLRADPALSVHESGSSLEAVSQIQGLGRVLVICHAKEEADVSRLVTLLKLLQEEVQSQRVRVIVTTSFNQVAVLSKLAFFGCAEIIPAPITAKALLFKLVRHVRAIEKGGEADRTEKAAEDASAADPSRGKAAGRGGEVKLMQPLGLGSDIWGAAHEPPKRLGGKWVAKLKGPPPSVGRWARVQTAEQTKDRQDVWCFKITNSDYEYMVPESGAWFAKGVKPEFKRELWWFEGTTPELSFYQHGKRLGSKFRVDADGNLCLTMDSQQASENLKLVPKPKDGQPAHEAQDGGSGGAASLMAGPATHANPSYRDPLDFESDCWLLDSRKPRQINGKWLLKLAGPPPGVGRWVEVKGQMKDGETLWRWLPLHPGHDPFIKNPGAWMFWGMAPKFDFDGWVFISKAPDLSFYKDRQKVASRLETLPTDGTDILWISTDSETAMSRAKDIRLALENPHRFAPEAGPDLVAGEATQEAAEDASGFELVLPPRDPRTGPRGPVETEREFRFPLEHFGTPVGRWEEVLGSEKGHRWFAYVPLVLLEGAEDAPQVQELRDYWIFRGSRDPGQAPSAENPEIVEWVFRGDEPRSVKRFGNLPKIVRDYLLNRFTLEETVDEAEIIEAAETEGVAGAPPIEIHVPTGALVGPLTLAFLTAELISKKRLGLSELSQRFCHYAASSVLAGKVELWSKTSGQWSWVASSDGAPGEWGDALKVLGEEVQDLPEGFTAAPVIIAESGADPVVGAVVFLDVPESQAIPPRHAQAVARVATGLMRAWGQTSQAPRAAA